MALRVVSNYLPLPKKTYRIIDALAYHAKSLYNVGFYNVRQHYATHKENRRILQGIRPVLTTMVEVLIGSYLLFTRKKDFPFKEYSDYVQSKPNENFGLLHNDNAQQTLRDITCTPLSKNLFDTGEESFDLPLRPISYYP